MQEMELVGVARLELDYMEVQVIQAALEELNIDRLGNWEDDEGRPIDDDWMMNLIEKIEGTEYKIWRTK